MNRGAGEWSSEFQQIEHRMIRRDGAVRKLRVRVGLLKDSFGNVIKWSGSTRTSPTSVSIHIAPMNGHGSYYPTVLSEIQRMNRSLFESGPRNLL
jgi:hypothetical protein